MTRRVTIGDCELWLGDCRRIERAYQDQALFVPAPKMVMGDAQLFEEQK